MLNSDRRDRRKEACNDNYEDEDHIIVGNAWKYLLFFSIWFIIASLFGFPIKEHRDKWHISNQATYQIVDKRVVFNSTTSLWGQMTLKGPSTQFTLKDVSEEVYNSKKVGEYITLELTDAEKFSDAHHNREGICVFLNTVNVVVFLGLMILAIAFVNVTIDLFTIRGHFLIKAFTIISVILGIVVLNLEYFC